LYADQILRRAINLAWRGGEFAGPRPLGYTFEGVAIRPE
jgi:hypothetical protein